MKHHGDINNRLVVLRAEKGWTQQELAKRLGVSRQTVVSLEANRYNPSLRFAFELAYVFGVPFKDVFQYVNEKGEALI